MTFTGLLIFTLICVTLMNDKQKESFGKFIGYTILTVGAVAGVFLGCLLFKAYPMFILALACVAGTGLFLKGVSDEQKS